MLRNTLNTVITATLIMLLGVSSSASAQTIVPMGDLMGSTSVTWGNDNQETTKSSALRVDLVPAEPRIKQDTSDESNDEQQPGEPVTVTYTITSEANGPDDYALATSYDNDVPSTNITAQPTTEIWAQNVQQNENSRINLGATAATGRPIEGSSRITVICDENYPSNSEINCNGIEALDTVNIGNSDIEYTVATGGVSNPDEGPSTITINLDEGLALPSIVVGTRIAEQKTFEVVVTGVALRNPAESGAVNLVVTGTSTAGNQGRASLAFDVTANPIPRSVDRYVRNLDNDKNPEAANVESTEFDWGGDLGLVNYYKTGVSAEEGDQVEILIVINAGNLADQSNISLLETLSPFVTYVADSAILYGEPIEDDVFAWIAGGVKPADDIGLSGRNGTQPNITIRKNTSANLMYKVTVIGGDGDGGGDDSQTAIAATYLGCLSDDSEVSAICEKDGTLWADVPEGKRVNQTACWNGQEDGEWVVGANDLSRISGDNQQEVLRRYADAGEEVEGVVGGWGMGNWTIGVLCDSGG